MSSETCSLPSQHGLRLDDLDHLQQARPKPDHPSHEGAIVTVQSNPWRRVPQCEVQLMPKKQNLGLEPSARLRQVAYKHSKGVKNREHRPSRCDDSAKTGESTPDGLFGKHTSDIGAASPDSQPPAKRI
jgi:hypothetical protein